MKNVSRDYGMSKKLKRKKRKQRKRKFEDETEYLEFIDAQLAMACIELDKKRRQDYIV